MQLTFNLRNIVLGLGLLVIVRYLFLYGLFRWHLHRMKGRNTVIPEYMAPPSISPAYFGTLLDNRPSVENMMATLLALHLKNILNITYSDEAKDYVVALPKASTTVLLEHEKYLVDVVARQPHGSLTASDFKQNSTSYLSDFNFLLQRDLQHVGYYHLSRYLDKLDAKGYYIWVVIRAAVKGLLKPWNWPGFFLVVVAPGFAVLWLGLVVFYYNRTGIYSLRTDQWEREWPQLAGYYSYLKRVEADRRSTELNRDPASFKISEHDPYLVAAQLQKRWQQIFMNGPEIAGGGREYNTVLDK